MPAGLILGNLSPLKETTIEVMFREEIKIPHSIYDPGVLQGSKARPVHKADNLIAISEPIV
jgi:hypothetical protein